jgi:hypothetical protein
MHGPPLILVITAVNLQQCLLSDPDALAAFSFSPSDLHHCYSRYTYISYGVTIY